MTFRSVMSLLVLLLVLLLGLTLPGPASAAAGPTAPPPPPDRAATAEPEPSAFVVFVLEDDGDCILRDAQHVSMRSSHPSRTIRVWLDRYTRGVGTGDRSRTDLKPGGEPEPLGCSRVMGDVQEWRVVRAIYVD